MESLLTLATQYAAQHRTKIISHRITGDQITFILESGPKHTMTPDVLQIAIEASGVTHRPAGGVPAGETNRPAEEEEKPKRKTRAK